ncbi:MAG: hypothetical protein JST86_07635 [Bacteroidetes bacterium]|nr:hypothetical protein [Bacteroidota bacterium]
MAKKIKEPIIAPVTEAIKTVKRKVYFFDIIIDFLPDFNPAENEDKFIGFFSIIAKMARDKDNRRYQPVLDAKVFMKDVIFIPQEKKITGKMLYVKTDVFPELIDMSTDITEDIKALENQGVVETTHFIIDYSRKLKKIAIEFNNAGAKSNDFKTYFQLIGIVLNAVRIVKIRPIVKDELSKFKEKIAQLSTLDVRVHKDNIDKIAFLDKRFFTMLKGVKEQYSPEYIEIKAKFSKKSSKTQDKIHDSVNNLLDGLVADNDKLNYFETLKVTALDRQNNYQSALFDFLAERVQSEMVVQRKPKHKVLISEDVFDKIKEEMRIKKI